MNWLKKLFQRRRPSDSVTGMTPDDAETIRNKVDNAQREMQHISRNSRRQIADRGHRNHTSRAPKGVVGYRV